ncbi:uncharacterized protein EDB91DRAFT_1242925 [Suillus paluster]|uniref:uncharacterized protein n=1 Tax=Suillus paluster TaxID=48578 RepID=UPI001B86EEA9|nr:uncharacterized protein EDB91DRAFT_1242925 [Suillus paluster]KAG1753967.1 hypothetical protein EDB91DRAFT_1242925 [Suillus paluster]
MPIPPSLRALLRTVPTLAPVSNRAVLSVSGSQATEFLNGLLASSVQGKQTYGAFLHAQGRVLYDAFMYNSPTPSLSSPGPTYLIEYDPTPSEAPTLISLLKRYLLRSKVRIRDVSEEWDVWAAWGSEGTRETREWNWARSGAVEPVWQASECPWGTENGTILDRRAPGMGKRMLVRKGDTPADASTHDLADKDAYLLHRIMHGVPEGSVDIQPMHAFPIESNLDAMGGLDFRKGCYVGQELTVRTYHTGVVRKRILPVHISSPASLPPYMSIKPSISSTTDNTAVKTPRLRGSSTLLSTIATSGIGSSVGLALVRLEHLRPGIALETGEEEQSWKVEPWWADWWPEQPPDEVDDLNSLT